MSSQQYTVLYVAIQGATLSEQASCSMTRDGHAIDIKTTVKGLSGTSPGAAMCEISVENMFPLAGLEFDAGDYIVSGAQVEIGIWAGGKTAVSKGTIKSDDIKGGVDTASGYSFKFTGTFPKFA